MNIRVLSLKNLVVAAAALAVAMAIPAPRLAAQDVKEHFTGFAINLNGRTATATVDFVVERWSTEAERTQLLNIITENKNPTDPLLRTLQKMPKVGYIRTPNTLAWDLRYAWQSPLDEGGRRIVVATDRPISFVEARNQPRTMDYPFTIVEVQLDKEDKGQGKILAGTKIYVEKGNIVLENYGQQPVRFNEIRKLK